MRYQFPEVNFPLPTPSGVDPAIARREVQQRNTAPTGQPSQKHRTEMIAHGVVERSGCYIESSIVGLVIRRAHSGEVVGKGFSSFDEVVAAAERGEFAEEERHA
ncbi:hypothetical protein [Pseudomonas cremoricolorata]|uniref:hypothetical protein n=1 Tax=Pseudomonas cremoricolorata TaxID=157783 RepID=UPI00048E1C15|nr:hypothetical protein [Pseudomonas cremoricolorata]